jgi:UDP-3-O-[3-hydroxymyristoyl] N-acetylglucosamine deacetylase
MFYVVLRLLDSGTGLADTATDLKAMRPQHTIGHAIGCTGVGLHTGQPISLTLRPAPPNTGIVFVRQNGTGPILFSASVRNLVPTELCTEISVKGTYVKTIEHVLAALVGLTVDNVYIELDGGEIPVMDGSAGPFVRLIRAAGIVPQDRRQPFLKVMRPIEVTDGDRRIRLEPSVTTRITYSIQYDHPLIETQTYAFDWSVSGFERDIAHARTFGFLKDVQALWARGLGKGGSLDNTIVLSDEGVLNQSGLRYHDEFVRHKILDLIGDLALLGVPFIGHLVADRAGHSLHAKLVEKILEERDTWVLLSTERIPLATEIPALRNAYGAAPAIQLHAPSAL